MSPKINKADKYMIQKVAIYIRVSTEEQAKEGYSISAQKQKLKAYCIAQGWDVSGVYVDEGISAKDMNRPQLQQMLKDIKSGLIDCVLVYRLDRLTRSVLDLYKLLETFEKHDCKFKSATEVFETTTALGRMFITIVAAMAQWERENTGERISMGFHEKVRQGKYALNFRSFGYNLDLKTGQLSINEEEAKTVRKIVDLYLKEGYGANRICQYLNERNILTRDGNHWNDKPLMQLLKNPIYKGTIKYGTEVNEDAMPAIIDKETFEEVQKTIERRRSLHPKQISSDYIFSGLIKCYECGSPLVGYRVYATLTTGEKMRYKNYRCMRKKTGECKSGRSFSEIKLESSFLRFIQDVDYSDVVEEVAAAGEKNFIKQEADLDVNTLKKELEKVDQRKKKWQYAWSEDLITDEDFKTRMDEARKKEEELKTLIQQSAPTPSNAVGKNELVELLKDMTKNWNLLSDTEKKSLTQIMVKQIYYNFDIKNQVYVTDIDFY